MKQEEAGEIVDRILRIDPERIILFGSRARRCRRGDAGPESDYDLLIIADSPLPRWRRTPVLYKALAGYG